MEKLSSYQKLKYKIKQLEKEKYELESHLIDETDFISKVTLIKQISVKRSVENLIWK